MRIFITAQSKEFIESKGFDPEIAEHVSSFFSREKDKKLKKHLWKNFVSNPKIIEQNRESILEDVNYIKKLFPVVAKDRAQDLVKHQGVSEYAANLALRLNEEYAEWIAKMIDNESIIPVEDDDLVLNTLAEFNKLKNSPNVPKEYKDINRYKQFGDLAEAVDILSGNKSKSQEVKDIISSSVSTAWDEGGVKVMAIDSPEAMAHYAKGKSWCVADEHWGRKYLRQGRPYYLFIIDGEISVLIHEASGQCKDPYNRPLTDAIIISRIQTPIEELRIKTTGGDFQSYHSTLQQMEEVNRKITEDPEYKKNYADTLEKWPDKHFLLYEENRKDPILFEATKNGYIRSLLDNEYKAYEHFRNFEEIDNIPEEFAQFIPQDFMERLVEFYVKRIDDEDVWAIKGVPQRVRVNFKEKDLDVVVQRLDLAVREDPRNYSEVPSDIRVRLPKKTVDMVKRYWLDILKEIFRFSEDHVQDMYLNEYFKDPQLPEYFLWSKDFITEATKILEDGFNFLKEKEDRAIASQWLAIPEHLEEEMDEDIKEEVLDYTKSQITDILSVEYKRATGDQIPPNTNYPHKVATPDDHLKDFFGEMELDDIKKFLEKVEMTEDRGNAWYSFIEAFPERIEDHLTSEEMMDFDIYEAERNGWYELISSDPWKIQEAPDYLLDTGDDQEYFWLADSYIDWAIHALEQAQTFEETPKDLFDIFKAEGFPSDEEEKWITYIIARIMHKTGKYEVLFMEEYLAHMHEEELKDRLEKSDLGWGTKKEEIRRKKGEFKDYLNQMYSNDFRKYFQGVISQKLNEDFYESMEEQYSDEIMQTLKGTVSNKVTKDAIERIEEMIQEPLTKEDLPELEQLVTTAWEGSRASWMTPKNLPEGITKEDLGKELILERIKRGDLENLNVYIQRMLGYMTPNYSHYSGQVSEPWDRKPIPEYLEEHDDIKRMRLKPWYEFIMKNLGPINNPQNPKQEMIKPWILENAPKEVLNYFEIKQVLEQPTVTSWYKSYKVKTAKIKTAAKIKDLCKVKTNYPDADFWIQRKGDVDKVGKPTKEYSPSHIGIKVDNTDVLVPDFLYYVFENLYLSGAFRSQSKGILNLQHITVDDIKNIPVL